MKVAVWGSYNFGNYGDELMALMVALHLRKLGAQPVVYGLPTHVANTEKLETTQDIDYALNGASFCVFGGGSLFSTGKANRGEYAEKKKDEYRAFASALDRHNCPLYLISVGGDGPFDRGADIEPFRRVIVNKASSLTATVRNRCDAIRLHAKYGMNATYCPDILLSLDRFWSLPRIVLGTEPLRVGLALEGTWRRVPVWASRFGGTRAVELVNLQTVRRSRLAIPKTSVDVIPTIEYHDPITMLHEIASLDLIVTHKLHIGLTAMAMGIPYICVGRTLKCKAFLYEVNSPNAYWGDKLKVLRKVRLFRLLSSKAAVKAACRLIDWDTVEAHKKESWGHLTALEHLCSTHGLADCVATP